MKLSRKSIPKPVRRFLRAGLAQFSEPVMRARGYLKADNLIGNVPIGDFREESNPLRDYFESHWQGAGIFKWHHYFEIYHRHFRKFIGRKPNVMEIGIYSGGSLEMWNSYFGPGCHIYGVDIQPECLSYQSDSVTVLIGDQGDRGFWNQIKPTIPLLDLIIDDGSHRAEDQIVTLEELLPHLKPGGVYLCEDIHNSANRFAQYINGFAANLHACDLDWEGGEISTPTTSFQSAIHSVHLYPYVVVIEKIESAVSQFAASKHGTEWQPFLSDNGKKGIRDGGSDSDDRDTRSLRK